MKRRTVLAGMASLPMAAGRLRVVATCAILADFVQRIGGDRVAITTLVPPDGDVHNYEPRPGDLRAIMEAGVLVENGFGLEGWMRRLTGAARFTGTHVVATAAITPRLVGGAHGAQAIDPHAWQDPRNGATYARAIAAGLDAADPAHASAYQAASDRHVADIEATDAWIARQFAPIPAAARRIITTHDAFGYYGARYGIEFLAAQGLSTEAEPSAKAIAALVAQIRRERVRTVFIENLTDPRLARMLARESGATLGGTVWSDSLSAADGPAATYLAMLRHNTTLFAAAMRAA